MKMKFNNFLILTLVFSFIGIISCSKTEENVPLVNIASLILTSDSSDAILVVDEVVNFTVTGDDEVIYNNQATFYVNGTEISGSSYTFDTEGSFEVYGSFAGINSNNLTFDVVNADQRTLLLDNEKAFPNQTITFILVDADGMDTTNDATIYVDDVAISGNTYSSSSESSHEVYATYEVGGDTQTTETKEFEVFIPKRKVVLEDYTGAWCGFCPAVAAAIEDAVAISDDITVVAIHQTSGSFPDPYHFPEVQVLKDEFGVDGLPAARINRTSTWSTPYAVGDVTAIAGEDTDAAIAISSQISGDNLTVEVKVLFENGSTTGDKLVLYLVESGIIYAQVNYFDDDPSSPYYQMGNPIPDFEHNEVLRQSLSGLFGDTIDATGAFGTFTQNFTATIPSDYVKDNLTLVAMLVGDDNTAKNSQHAHVNEDADFE